MKKFKNAKDAFEWAKEVIENGCVTAEEVIAEEIYKDSNEFTYRDTGDMYKSGEMHSRFKEGIITEEDITRVVKLEQEIEKHNLDGLKKLLLKIKINILNKLKK